MVPLPKKHPPKSVENDLRPISLTPIVSKVFESLVLEKWVTQTVLRKLDNKFSGIPGTSTTDALVKMVHKWYEATDQPGSYARTVMIDYNKALINST